MASALQPNTIALVTGAALGIGRAAARSFALKGMSVAMVDLPGADFDKACAEIESVAAQGADAILKIEADLGEQGSVNTINDAVMARFGGLNVLMNNAVTRAGHTFDGTLEEWRKSMEVNLWAVIGLVRLFQPVMIASGTPGYIINVGSKQGITNPPGTPAYNMVKAALKSYTEQLEHALRTDPKNTGPVSAHLLIPGWTTTGKNEHKPGAWLPDQVVDFMIEALERRDFYILCPDDEVSADMDHRRIIWGAEDITRNRPPLSRWHPEFKAAADKACS